MILVSRKDIAFWAKELEKYTHLGLDTETTGLKESDRAFLVSIATEDRSLILNLHPYEGLNFEYVLRPEEVKEVLSPVLKKATTFIQNAKFDMRMLAHMGLDIEHPHCTYAVERVLKNNYIASDAYRLSGIAKRRFPDTPKDDAVLAYVNKNKLFDYINVPGKAKREKEMHFEKVPWEIMFPYATRDAELHYKIGMKQVEEIDANITALSLNEKKLTKTCFKMERRGIRLDLDYTKQALKFEMDLIRAARERFEKETGYPFIDSNKLFAEVFTERGVAYPKTAKGNPSFNADSLESFDDPLAKMIKDVRNHEKKVGTYYSSFLYYANGDRIHPDIRQAGTESGRFSFRNPNLQNIPKEDEPGLTHYVRKCFIPSEDHTLVMIDYQQQEFRLMLDYAGETRLIQAINDGADVHQATADLLGITRKQAKTINFGLLYGMGIEKLAQALEVPVKEAKRIKWSYFAKLPKVERFIRKVIKTGETRGHIYNWLGRRCFIERREWAYILPNHLIQGSGADVIKMAMNEIESYLSPFKSNMILQVHDELVFDIHKDEYALVPEIQKIMENIYPSRNGMLLTCSVEHSNVSWGYCDKQEGVPQ